MSGASPIVPTAVDARSRLLAAAITLIRRQGYAGTSVNELCAAAGVTKGAFFHHFASKEALGVAAAQHWQAATTALFAAAPHHAPATPFGRIMAYLDYRTELVAGEAADYSCLLGTMVQEVFASAPAVRDACHDSMASHIATLEDDFAALIAEHGAPDGLTARMLASHTQTVLQGGFILAKAADDAGEVRRAIEHLRRYIRLLFPTAAA